MCVCCTYIPTYVTTLPVPCGIKMDKSFASGSLLNRIVATGVRIEQNHEMTVL